ncbi:hypothetical protein [Nitrososphaera sp.]|uniref:hypothetical protein n=1 Tax=Nitrososphaera sp. TaxID=1971748 RepID=UPI002EDBAAB8
MVSVEKWMQWIAIQILSVMGSPCMLESTLKARAGHHADGNLDLALRRLMDMGVLKLDETERQRTYSIPETSEKLAQARDIANNVPIINTPSTPEVVQNYLPDPEGFEYWFTPPDNPSRVKKKSIYDYFRGSIDLQDYAARIRSQSSPDPELYYTGSIHDPDSWAAKAWKIINELARASADGTFSLMQLLKRDNRVFEGGTKRRGKILLAIFEREGWIVKVEKRGNSVLYRLSDAPPPEPKHTNMSIEDYVNKEQKPKSEPSDFNEGLDEMDESIQAKGKKDSNPANDSKSGL